MRIIVFHTEYGCESGCCGHAIKVEDAPPGFRPKKTFAFSHPYGNAESNWQATPEVIREYIIDLVTKECGAEHVKDIDFDRCVVVND